MKLKEGSIKKKERVDARLGVEGLSGERIFSQQQRKSEGVVEGWNGGVW